MVDKRGKVRYLAYLVCRSGRSHEAGEEGDGGHWEAGLGGV